MAHNPAPLILLTRPAAQSAAYKAALEAEFGLQVSIVVSPLLAIQPFAANIDLEGVTHLLFTSVNGVEAFVRLSDRRDIPALCVGARTNKAATVAGIVARSANGSAADLVELAKDSAGPFLYPRGVHMAHDIAAELRAFGKKVTEVIAYDQQPLAMNAQAKAALTSDTACLVPLFSPRSARLFMAESQGLKLQATTLICLSQNVADQLRPAQLQNLTIAANPTAAAVTREIAAAL